MDEQNKFLAWHQKEVNKGLTDIKFYVGEGSFTKNATTEEFFHEANRVNELYEQKKFVHRADVF
jgi:hypothetical protein